MSRQIKIRTKEKNRTIRVLNKSAGIARNIKQSVIKTKESAENTQNPSWDTPQEYAEDKLKTGAEKMTVYVKRDGKRVIRRVRKRIERVRQGSEAVINMAKRTGKARMIAEKMLATLRKRVPDRIYSNIAAAGKAVSATVAKTVKVARTIWTAVSVGGGTMLGIIVVICLVGLMIASPFGIFYSGQQAKEKTMPEVIREINAEYQNQLERVKAAYPHDNVEMSGSAAAWRDVLAVFAVKTVYDVDQPTNVAVMDKENIQLLKDVFWEMNEIASKTVVKDVVTVVETDDGKGNIIRKEMKEQKSILQINVLHKTADQMAAQYDFDLMQRQQLDELLDEENRSLWLGVQFGAELGDIEIVEVALSQVGNVGGDPYWSWYGFKNHVDWCACFVSWCADQCGYIENGVIPKYAGCVTGTNWFKERGQWLDGKQEPAPGMIIFFDWDDPEGSSGPQDGEADHTGIIVRVEGGTIYTVEGNCSDSCKEKRYSVGHYEILGYGVPAY